MPSFCVVSDCELKYSHSQNISFHKFPVNNPEILDLWIKFTGRGPMYKPSRWSSICSRHFNKCDFREFLKRRYLIKNAIPTCCSKNSISYKTYDISNNFTNNSNAPTLYSNNETDEYGAISEAKDDHVYLMTCLLCGERVNKFSNDDGNQLPQSLDDFGIDTMMRKCLPTINLGSDNDQSRVICGYCHSQLKQYSIFLDRVHSYQKDLIYSNSNCQDYVETNNNNQTRATDTLPESSNSIFIKQEPTINVKQEKCDGFNNCRKDLLEREQVGNCEIMEIVTLNNPVSVIDLAAEDDPTGHVDRTKKLKTESLLTSGIDWRVEVEHAYAKKVHQAGGTVHHLKQEIAEIMNDDLDENTEHVSDDSISNEINSVETEPHIERETNMTCQSIEDHQEYSPPTLMKRECSFCDAVFETVTEYLRHKTKIHRHERNCNKNFKYVDNNYLNRRRKGMSTHKENSKEKSKVRDGVSNHSAVSKTLAIYASDLGKFVCTFCYRLFAIRRIKNFAEHQEMHIRYNHPKDPKNIFTNQLLLSERDVKGNLFSSRISPRNLKTLKTIMKDMQVICINHCDLSQLTITDTQAKFIYCGLCPSSHPKRFKFISGLKQHISGFHYKIKPYICSECGASFSLKSDSFRCRHSQSISAKNNDK